MGIDQTVSYAGQAILSSAGIVDTGTTLTLLATGARCAWLRTPWCADISALADAFQKYAAATGAIKDDTTGLFSITPAQFANLQSLFFTIGTVRYFIWAMEFGYSLRYFDHSEFSNSRRTRKFGHVRYAAPLLTLSRR